MQTILPPTERKRDYPTWKPIDGGVDDLLFDPSGAYITKRQLAWVPRHLPNDPARIQRVCTHYKVASLEQVTFDQTTNLLDRLL